MSMLFWYKSNFKNEPYSKNEPYPDFNEDFVVGFVKGCNMFVLVNYINHIFIF